MGAKTTGSLGLRELAEQSHGLVVAYGTAPSELDRWIAIRETTLIGRASPNFGEVYHTLSRRHAELSIEGGALRVKDLGSRFGTLVNGARIEGEASLYDGDVVTFGRIGMVVASAPLTFAPRPVSPLVFVSWRVQELLDDLSAVARTPYPVALLGAPGTGKLTFARYFASLVSDRAPCEASDATEWPPVSELDPRRPIVLRMTHGRDVRAYVRALLAREERPRLVLLGPSLNELGDDLASRFDGTTFHVPDLSERREDILPIVRARLRDLSGRDVEVAPRLALGLLRRQGTLGVRGLIACTDVLYFRQERAAKEEGVLEVDRPVDGPSLAAPPTQATVPATPDVHAPIPPRHVVVSRSGSHFQVGADLVALEHRKPLVRILARLATAHAASPRGSVDRAELIGAGWPNESILPTSASHRLHVAISTLRALGLAEVLVRRGAGYALVGEIAIV